MLVKNIQRCLLEHKIIEIIDSNSASSKILYEFSQINTIDDYTRGILRSFSLSLQETSSEKLGSFGICLRAFVVALLEKKVCSSDTMSTLFATIDVTAR